MKLKKILLSLVMAFSLFTGMTFAADKVDLNTANQAQLEMLMASAPQQQQRLLSTAKSTVLMTALMR